ncbi:MAG: APC family permease [Kineosporiaceae bacterium]|nr:APC family permease [Kineosporiaceae bacterium]MBK7624346.1 APC family permease [Kineosporiaceae bacterium]MBK8075230.1 APC family permease [Kineosporiaceae bacterium]
MAQQKAAPNRLEGKLTLIDATAQSIGFMGPVFSMAFLVPLLVGMNASEKGAGMAAPLAVLLAAVGVLGLGWIVSEYARRIAAAGSLYDYISDGFGSRVGAAFGFLYYGGILGLGAGLLVLIGGTIHDTLLGEFEHALLPEGVWDILLLIIVGVVLYLGVALSTRTQLVLAMVSIAAVLLFALYVIIKVGGDNDLVTAFNPSASTTGGFNGIFFGVLYGVLLFTGFETAANLGEETAHPKRDIPRAVLISVITIAGFYVLVTYAQVAGYGFNMDNLGANAGAPLFGLTGPVADGGFGSTGIRILIEIMVILDMLAVLIGVSVAASRGIFALARDKRLPHGLATVSSRSTPLNATALVVALYAVLVLVTLFVPSFVAQSTPDGPLPHYVAVFYWFSTLGSVSLATIYLVMSIGAYRGLADHPSRTGVYLAATVGTLVTGAALFGAVYKVPAPLIYAAYTALGVLIVGGILTVVFPGEDHVGDQWEPLAEADHGPQKL